jgi:hypothetical protein
VTRDLLSPNVAPASARQPFPHLSGAGTKSVHTDSTGAPHSNEVLNISLLASFEQIDLTFVRIIYR